MAYPSAFLPIFTTSKMKVPPAEYTMVENEKKTVSTKFEMTCFGDIFLNKLTH